ncbi:MAG: M20/M25/M40 family metallo-hydrolase [Phycisphaerales bacterium]|nr:M20/M25/M40 family metallo-hydrolase [Phycisphaerales bacterium]
MLGVPLPIPDNPSVAAAKRSIANDASSPHLATVAAKLRTSMITLLGDLIRIPSTSGHEKPLVDHVAAWASQQSFICDLWETPDQAIAAEPLAKLRHLPLKGRPTLVVKSPTSHQADGGILLNAHSDVVAAPQPERWQFDPFSGHIENSLMFGRGACDTKGPLVSGLWAMAIIQQAFPKGIPGGLHLELVPGEEDCVGLGTLTSVLRGHTAAASIVLEPTEGLPRCASRGGCRFTITLIGQAVHGTVKWLGKDAIALARDVLEALAAMEKTFSHHDEGLFSSYPIGRPITVDNITGQGWQGTICDQCVISGYFELLPNDELSHWKNVFQQELLRRLPCPPSEATLEFSEEYHGHRLEQVHPLCQYAQHTLADEGESLFWQGFNSGCEAGLRATRLATPTLVWGPGSLVQAHGINEYVNLHEVEQVALRVARLAIHRAYQKSGQV